MGLISYVRGLFAEASWDVIIQNARDKRVNEIRGLLWREFARHSHMPQTTFSLAEKIGEPEDEVLEALRKFPEFEMLKDGRFQTRSVHSILKVRLLPGGGRVTYVDPDELIQQPDVIRQIKQMRNLADSKGGVPFTLRD